MYEILVTLEDEVKEKEAKEMLELIKKSPEVADAILMGEDEED